MPIYDIDGNQLAHAYDIDGNELSTAYDIDGNVIYTAESPVIKVMTYNVGGWYDGGGTNVPTSKDEAYYQIQNGIFENNNVDVLCMQEYMTQFSDTRTAESVLSPYFTYRNCRQVGTYYGRGICSKYELSDYTVSTYTDDVNRYYDKAYINVGGRHVAVFTTHFDPHSFENRKLEVQQLITALSNEEYFICCGDYNVLTIRTDSEAITETDDYVHIVTPLLNAGFHCANWSDNGFIPTMGRVTPLACIDGIITSSNIDVLNVYTDASKVGNPVVEYVDHIPFIATLQIN